MLDGEGEPVVVNLPPEQRRVWKDEQRRAMLASHPLVPLIGHRMMPAVLYSSAEPPPAGAPVYSMHGNDCIEDEDSFWTWPGQGFREIDVTSLVPMARAPAVPAPPASPWYIEKLVFTAEFFWCSYAVAPAAGAARQWLNALPLRTLGLRRRQALPDRPL